MENDGTTRHLVDPVSERFGSKIGPKLSTMRASHVESWNDLSDKARAWIHEQRKWVVDILDPIDPNLFWADMLPVGGPVMGPFSQYEQAIEAEIRWLQQNNLPTSEGDSSGDLPLHTLAGARD